VKERLIYSLEVCDSGESKTGVIEVCVGKPEVLEMWDLGEGRTEALEVCKGKTVVIMVYDLREYKIVDSTSAKGRLRYLRSVGQD